MGGNSLVGGRPEEPGTVDAEGEDLPPGDLIHGRWRKEGLDPRGL